MLIFLLFQRLQLEQDSPKLLLLQYQILLASVQGRSPNIAFLPLVSLPELENWIETWAFSETIHSRSYTHIIRAIVNEPGVIFDDIMQTDEIIQRAQSVSKNYDDLIKSIAVIILHGLKMR